MKTYKEPVSPYGLKKREYTTICDLCGKTMNASGFGCGEHFEPDETEVSICIKHSDGPHCKQYGYMTVYEVDVCPACFKQCIIPWLKDHGAKIEPCENDEDGAN